MLFRYLGILRKDLWQFGLLRGYFVWRLPYSGGRKVALTFDDGPDPVYTEKVRALLKEKGVKATFFLIGQNIEKYPMLVKELIRDGHILGNHGYSHKDVLRLTRSEISDEVRKTEVLIRNLGGDSRRLFRPPRLKIDRRSMFYLRMERQCVVLGISSKDYCAVSKEQIWEKVYRDAMDRGGIIVFHDNNQHTVEALGKIIDDFKNRGFQFVTL